MRNISTIIESIEAYNNTVTYEINGKIYIDSLKYPRVFEALGKKLGFSVTTLDKPTDKEVLCGEKQSGFSICGVNFNCNAMLVTFI